MLSVVNCENKEVILSGDLNCYYVIANDYKEIKDTVKINGLKQIIDKPTRISKDSRTIIDIASSDDSKIGDKSVFPSCLSDHKLAGVIRKMHIKRFTARKVLNVIIQNLMLMILKMTCVMRLGRICSCKTT